MLILLFASTVILYVQAALSGQLDGYCGEEKVPLLDAKTCEQPVQEDIVYALIFMANRFLSIWTASHKDINNDIIPHVTKDGLTNFDCIYI